MGGPRAGPEQWRYELRRAVAVTLALKLAALALLWALFFAPAHRTRVDAEAASQHLRQPPVAHAAGGAG
jgi:uncharacterized membrane protein